jgi:hypothetical protein
MDDYEPSAMEISLSYDEYLDESKGFARLPKAFGDCY